MSLNIIRELKTALEQADQTRVLRALRQEPLVWSSLEDEEFFSKVLAHTRGRADYWSPASLSLLALDQGEVFQQLMSSPEQAIENGLRTQALSAYDSYMNSSPAASHLLSLPQAGLLALALRERWRLNGSWNELIKTLDNLTLETWKPVFACLYGLLANPRELIQRLVSSEPHTRLYSLAVHALLSNPVNQSALADILITSLSTIELEKALPVLRLLNQQSPQLAKETAAALVNRLDSQELGPLEGSLDFQHLLQKTEVYQISGQYDKAMPLLDAAWERSRKQQTEMAARLAQSAAEAHDEYTAQRAMAHASEIDPNAQELPPGLSLAQLQTGQLDPRYLKYLEEPTTAGASHPASLAAMAKLALQADNLPKAQELACQALDIISQHSNFSEEEEKTLQSLAELLVETNLPGEAKQAAELALTINPNHPATLMQLSKAQLAAGDNQSARDTAQIAVTLAPKDLALQRFLAQALAANQDWDEALHTWEEITAAQNVPPSEDYHQLAECAIAAGQPNKAVQASQRVLNSQPQNGQAHALLGQAYSQLGDITNAQQHFNQAISFAPNLAEPWLALADYHISQGEIGLAQEKLTAATEAIPQDPKIRLALGKLYLDEGNTHQGLAEVQQASLFIDGQYDLQQQAALLTGKAQLELGRTYDARQKLAQANKDFPHNQKIAHLFGKALLDSGEIEHAIHVLGEVTHGTDAPIEAQLDYADAQLKLGIQLQEAKPAIETVLRIEPENATALALLAETLSLEGQHEQALKVYKSTMGSNLVEKEGWQARLSAGMAKSALALNQPEAAIAAIEEILGQMPEDISVLKTLCQAYMQANLNENAASTLAAIHQMGQEDVSTMLWVADQAIRLDQGKLASHALTKAMELDPEHANVLVRMGYLQLHQQDPEAARQTFNKLFKAKMLHTSDLRLAAQALSDMGDISSSVPYLEKALELGEEDQSTLLADLTKVHLQAGNYNEALETIEKQLVISPNDPALIKSKADILVGLKQTGAALTCLRQALELDPQNHRLLYEIAQLQRENRELAAALENIEKALSIAPENKLVRFLAAEINHAAMQTKRVNKLLNQVEPQREPGNPSWVFRKSEYLLDAGRFDAADKALEGVAEVAKDHPRLLANQARIRAHEGEQHQAHSLYNQAMVNLSKTNMAGLKPDNRNNIRLALVETAMTLNDWETAINMAEQSIDDLPAEPQPYLALVKALVRRAEFQHLCQETQAIKHAPGDSALDEEAYQSFSEAIHQVQQHLPKIDESQNPLVEHWLMRGNLAMGDIEKEEPSLPHAKNADECAALVSAHRRQGKTQAAIKVAEEFSEHPQVQLQNALALAGEEPVEAVNNALQAVQGLPENPLALALVAMLSKEGQDPSLALESIQGALEQWGDEPRWHALAAQLYNRQGHLLAVIGHLEQAIQLEPDYSPYYHNLAKALMEDQRYNAAIDVLEKAPDDPDYQAETCKQMIEVYRLKDDYQSAIQYVDQLIEASPNQLEPLLIGAEIALEGDNKQLSEEYLLEAELLEPNNPSTLHLQAKLLASDNRPKEALRLLDQAIGQVDEPLPLLLERAKLVPMVEGEQAGLNTLIALEDEYPDEPALLSQLSKAFIKSGQSDEAIRAAQRALKFSGSKLTPKEQAELQYQIGTLMRQNGQLDQAVKYLDEAIQRHPAYLEAYLEIAEAYQQRREPQKGIEYLQQAIAANPLEPAPYRQAGMLMKEMKDYSGAENMLRRAADLAPKDLDIQRKLGTVIALSLVHQKQPQHYQPTEIKVDA